MTESYGVSKRYERDGTGIRPFGPLMDKNLSSPVGNDYWTKQQPWETLPAANRLVEDARVDWPDGSSVSAEPADQ